MKHSSTHRAASHSGHQNTVSFLLLFLLHTTHLLVGMAFFSVGGILSGKCLSTSRDTFLSVEWWPWNFLTLSLWCSISRACTSSTLNLKWSMFMQGTNLLRYYLCNFILYFNAIYVLLITAFWLGNYASFLWTSVFLLRLARVMECSGTSMHTARITGFIVSETSVAWVRQAIVRHSTDTIRYRRATYARVGLVSPLHQGNVCNLWVSPVTQSICKCFQYHFRQIQQRLYQTSYSLDVSVFTSAVSFVPLSTGTQRTWRAHSST